MAAEAVARARRGDGPTLIEAETYRFRGHSLADPDELRQKEEKDHYQVGSEGSLKLGACLPRLPVSTRRCQHLPFALSDASQMHQRLLQQSHPIVGEREIVWAWLPWQQMLAGSHTSE